MDMLEINALTRTFRTPTGSYTALRDVNLTISEGETVGLLGVNGAGKTTLLKIISTLLLPDSGTVRVCGVNVVTHTRQARTHLSVVLGGERGFYNRLNAEDNVRYFAFLAGLSTRDARRRTDEVLEEVGLGDARRRRVETFSKGMKQRLHIACGLITIPRLLLLDEPTVGLDPIEAQRLRGAVADLREQGVTVLLTSHYMGDIERLASRAVVLRDGVIAHDQALDRMIGETGAAAEVAVLVRGEAQPAIPDGIGGDSGVRLISVNRAGALWSVTLEVSDWSPDTLRALAAMWPAGDVADVRVRPASLENLFGRLTSEDHNDVPA